MVREENPTDFTEVTDFISYLTLFHSQLSVRPLPSNEDEMNSEMATIVIGYNLFTHHSFQPLLQHLPRGHGKLGEGG